MAEFLKDYGGHIIAVIALLQVPAIALWKRYFQRPTLSFHPSGQIQLAFGELGPNLWIIGTLRSDVKPVFVESLSCRITRATDKATREFDWAVLRNTAADAGSVQQNIATGFLVHPVAPASRQVMFTVNQIRRDYDEVAQGLRERWQGFLRSQLEAQFPEAKLTELATHAQDPQIVEPIFRGFLNEDAAHGYFSTLNNQCFWHAGKFRIELKVAASEVTETSLGVWSLQLSEDDEKRLRLNVVAALRLICGLQRSYNTVLKDYERAAA